MTGQEDEKLLPMSRMMAHVCLGAMIVIPLGYLLIWFGAVGVSDVMGIRGASAFIASPETGALRRLGGFALSMVPQLALLYGLVRLRQLFTGFAAGDVFGEAASDSVRGFARALLTFAVLDFVVEAPLSALVTWDNPPGERMITLSLGWDDFHIYFLILLFFALTHVMAEGIRLARENAEFV